MCCKNQTKLSYGTDYWVLFLPVLPWIQMRNQTRVTLQDKQLQFVTKTTSTIYSIRNFITLIPSSKKKQTKTNLNTRVSHRSTCSGSSTIFSCVRNTFLTAADSYSRALMDITHRHRGNTVFNRSHTCLYSSAKWSHSFNTTCNHNIPKEQSSVLSTNSHLAAYIRTRWILESKYLILQLHSPPHIHTHMHAHEKEIHIFHLMEQFLPLIH